MKQLEEVVSHSVYGCCLVLFLTTSFRSLTGIMLHPPRLMTSPQVSHSHFYTTYRPTNIGTDGAVSKPPSHYGGSFLLSTVQAFQKMRDQAAEGPREELQQYLKIGVESTTDILGWWGVRLPLFDTVIYI